MEERNCTYCGHDVPHDMDLDPDDPVFCGNDCEIQYWRDEAEKWKERAQIAETELEDESI